MALARRLESGYTEIKHAGGRWVVDLVAARCHRCGQYSYAADLRPSDGAPR